MKILVVDNDQTILEFMHDLLSKEGHEVVTAKDGLSALDVLEAHTPDVVFFDLVMPNIDGKKLCKISGHRQAICITHLPQIAVFADSHYSVYKKATGNRTTSMIELLQGDEQLKEVTLMLSGPQHTEIADKTAGELMEKATVWKKNKVFNDQEYNKRRY